MSKLSRHMPGRRVSRHSKKKTFPATVALLIFKSNSRMGAGLALMGFPISTLPTAGLPPFPPLEAEAAGAGRAASGALHVTSISTLEKP